MVDLNESAPNPWPTDLNVSLVERGILRCGPVGRVESLGLGFDFKGPHHFQLESCSLSLVCGSDFSSQLPAAVFSTMLVWDFYYPL